jgi:hypothetical protein
METFVGDTVKILLNTYIDLTGYSTIRIKYEKPDGTTGYWTASVCPDNSYYIMYTTFHSDLNIYGTWKLQGYVAHGGEYLHGKYATLQVLQPLV